MQMKCKGEESESHLQIDEGSFAAVVRLAVPDDAAVGATHVEHQMYFVDFRAARVADAREVHLQVAAAVKFERVARVFEGVAHVQPVRRKARRRRLPPEPVARRRRHRRAAARGQPRHRHVLLGLQRQPVRVAQLEARRRRVDADVVLMVRQVRLAGARTNKKRVGVGLAENFAQRVRVRSVRDGRQEEERDEHSASHVFAHQNEVGIKLYKCTEYLVLTYCTK